MDISKVLLNSKDLIRTSKIKNNLYKEKYYYNLSKYYNLEIPINKSYKFFIIINCEKINIFHNAFSIPLQRIIHLSVINWMNSIIKNDIFKTKSNLLNQPGIAINYKLFNSPTKLLEYRQCRDLDTTNQVLQTARLYKIHINIKLKYLFWVIRKIIDNSEKFIDDKPLFSSFKFHTDFWRFSILEEKYKSPNICFYQYQDIDPEITKIQFQKLIKILLELFPNDLHISSKIYSQFSIRINNNIYLGIGDGNEKIDKSDEYTIPIEYQKMIDSCKNNKSKCDEYNKIITKLSNHKLDDEDIYYLVKKNNNSLNKIFKEIGLSKII